MPVSAHGDQVAALPLDPLDDFLGRFAVGEFNLSPDAGLGQFGLDPREVGSAGFHFLAGGLRAVKASRDARGDVEQDHPAAHQLCQWLDVLDNRPVRAGAFQSQENCFVHILGLGRLLFGEQSFYLPQITRQAVENDSGRL